MINTSPFDRVLYLNLTQDNTLSLAERIMEPYSGCQESYCFATLFICFNCQFLSRVMFPLSGSFGSDVHVNVVGRGRS